MRQDPAGNERRGVRFRLRREMRFDVRARMARPGRVQKSQKDDHAQPSLPTGNAVPADGIRILPMQLRLGDRLTAETGEYEVIGRPYTTAGGKPPTSASSGSIPGPRCFECGARTSASR